MFQELATQEANDGSRKNISQELLNLIHNDNSVVHFIELLYNIKNKYAIDKKKVKSICNLNQKYKSDANPLVDLKIEGYHV